MPAFCGYIRNGTFEGDPVISRRRAKSLKKVCCITDEEKHVASLWQRRVPENMQVDPGVASPIVQSGRSSRLLEANKKRGPMTKNKRCADLALWRWRCTDVARRSKERESVCGLHEKTNLQHPSIEQIYIAHLRKNTGYGLQILYRYAGVFCEKKLFVKSFYKRNWNLEVGGLAA